MLIIIYFFMDSILLQTYDIIPLHIFYNFMVQQLLRFYEL